MTSKIQRTPLFMQIADAIRGEIGDKYAVGERLPGDAALARRFGVSGVTVRQAMATLAQEGLVVRRQGSGTHVADSLPQTHIALYSEEDLTITGGSPFMPLLMFHLRRRLEEEGLEARCYSGRHRSFEEGEGDRHVPPEQRPPTCEAFLEALQANRLRGVVVMGTWPNPVWVEPLSKRGIPVVGDATSLSVKMDALGAVAGAVDRALAAGRRRIALLHYCPPWAEASPLDGQILLDTRNAFIERMGHHGLPVVPQWMCGEFHPQRPGAGWDGFRNIWARNAGERPDALIVTDDMLLRDMALAIAELRVKVPEQLFVVAHCNLQAPVLLPFPTLRMVFDACAYADALGRLLLRSLAGDAHPEHIVVPTSWEWDAGISMAPAPTCGQAGAMCEVR